MDSQLSFWLAAALLLAQEWWKRQNADADAADALRAAGKPVTPSSDRRIMSTQWRAVWAIAMGVACANAFSVKMTGVRTR